MLFKIWNTLFPQQAVGLIPALCSAYRFEKYIAEIPSLLTTLLTFAASKETLIWPEPVLEPVKTLYMFFKH